MPPPFAALRYLYMGVDDVAAAVRYHREVLGAALVWWFRAFGTEVAAVDPGGGPLVLLAGHRPAPSLLPVYAVDDLDATVRALAARGWTAKEGPFGIPDGDCYLFVDPAGNELAFYEATRPDALVAAYADPENTGAVRPDDGTRGGTGGPATQ